MPEQLYIDRLRPNHRGVPANLAGSYHDAARVCLDRHHSPPAYFFIEFEDHDDLTVEISWLPADDELRAGWANYLDATEAGACAVALAVAERVTGLVAVSRAYTGSGADYFLGPVGESMADLETCLRLEISGLDRGTRSAVATRLRQKLSQAERGESDVPAIAIVVGFSAKLVLGARVEEE
jgi:hypothetical protein